MTTQCCVDRVKDFGLTLKEKPLQRGMGQLVCREWAVGGRSDKNWLCWTNSSFDKCCE